MGDPLRKPAASDPFKPSAQQFGMFIDAAADFKARTQNIGRKDKPLIPQRTIIPIKNMSGSDRQRFDVLEIFQPLFPLTSDSGKERPMAVGTTPAGPTGKIAVLLEPIKVGYVGSACVSGVTVARVNVTDVNHKWADLEEGECLHLASKGDGGAGFILSPITETGSQYVLLKISNPRVQIRRFTLKTALAPNKVGGGGAYNPGSTATAYLVDSNPDTGALTVNTDIEFTVRDQQNRFRGAAYDSERWDYIIGYAEQMSDSEEWEIITMTHKAERIKFKASAAYTTASASVSATVEDFFNGYNPDPTGSGLTVYNWLTSTGAYRYKGDQYDFGWAWYDWTNDKYWIYDTEQVYDTIVYWAKAQADWSGSAVSCKDCDVDGNNVTGDAFNVLLPHGTNGMSGDPCIFEDAVIGYLWTVNAVGTLVRVCVTDYMDDKIGTVKMWVGALEDIPKGWRVLEVLKGKFPVGAGEWTEGAWEHEYALGATGGHDYHGYDLGEDEHVNDHDDHADHGHHVHAAVCSVEVDNDGGGTDAKVWFWGYEAESYTEVELDADTKNATTLSHDEHTITDNRPKFYAIYIIERFE